MTSASTRPKFAAATVVPIAAPPPSFWFTESSRESKFP
eukprot:CAMPEP_0198152500 /NCGR_PEP_ID=MMETSP1443-20131203/60057_1 /TAXON_ID=186043 /ORGANISM="Entomoneis sp., Strain CCMP2396" /LENGTH=37 /DNA_ID= /DNA_START= /DNA_END= /DNA_ORIENTATION=